MIKLILNGEAKNMQGRTQGIYSLGEKLLNSNPYWEQQDGSNALWFNLKFREWTVGPKIYLGQEYGVITGPTGIDKSPTNIVNGWRYDGNGIWKEAATSEILIKDLSLGML